VSNAFLGISGQVCLSVILPWASFSVCLAGQVSTHLVCGKSAGSTVEFVTFLAFPGLQSLL